MKKNPVIALAQIKYFDWATKNNTKKIIKYIRLAKKRGADIICFPESCLIKSSLNLKNKILKDIQEECKKNSIWCIVTDDINIKGKTYNLSVLIDRNGKIKGGYKKIHLYGDKNVIAGKESMVFNTDFGKIGIAICWDVAFPLLFKEMKKRGAQIVFCPSQWWYDAKFHKANPKSREIEIIESLLLARAYENIFFVAMCNPVLDSKFQVSYSGIASPTKIIKEIIKKEGLVIAKINLGEIKKIEKIYKS
jgi:predicted amidohydrolase